MRDSLGRRAAELSDAKIHDAWSELANMVGGRQFAGPPGVSRLTLPRVGPTPGFAYRTPGAELLNELAFACQGRRCAAPCSASLGVGLEQAPDLTRQIFLGKRLRQKRRPRLQQTTLEHL